MSPASQHVARKHAERLFKDPTKATVDDVRKLVNAVLMMTGGKP